uniref:Putative conserved plasma membrane protein n=1 Tax=Amblyomma aureolatum TaxID=187763 RepID=A0A1E1X0W3_9ACAR
MESEEPKGPVMRPKFKLEGSDRKVTFNRECEITRNDDEQKALEECPHKDGSAYFQITVFFITIIIPFVGSILYAFNRHARRDSPQYIWSYRALQLGTALSVIYSFVICSVLHHYQLQSLKGDLTGFSYTRGNI